jgi:hypothetical protein
LLTAIDSFFKLIATIPASPEAIQLAFAIRRFEYQGNPADVNTLVRELKWTRPTVQRYLKELHETFGYRTERDKDDARRSVQRIPAIEHVSDTAFFGNCFAVVDTLVADRKAARQLKEPSRSGLSKLAKACCLIPAAVAGSLGWAICDPDGPMDEVYDVAMIVEDGLEMVDDWFDGEEPTTGSGVLGYTKGGHVTGSVIHQRVSYTKGPATLPRRKGATVGSLRVAPGHPVRTNQVEQNMRVLDRRLLVKRPI